MSLTELFPAIKMLPRADKLCLMQFLEIDRAHKETIMTYRRQTKLVREGEYVAEVEIELIDTAEGWSPYVSLEDAQKLDAVREALRRGDLRAASKLSQVFHLTPVTA
jgi:hypothetical protein